MQREKQPARPVVTCRLYCSSLQCSLQTWRAVRVVCCTSRENSCITSPGVSYPHCTLTSSLPIRFPQISDLDGVALPEGELDPVGALHRADPLHRGDRGQVERAERQAAGGHTAVLKLSNNEDSLD